MANMVDLFKGGSPVVKYMWDEKDYVQFGGSFAENGFSDTPPYDSHVDGAYNVGNFCLGMPINPKIMAYQRKALTRHPLKVGDVLWLFWIPYDHFATYFNLKIRTGDPAIAGLTLKPVAGKLTKSNSELAGKHFNANLVDEELNTDELAPQVVDVFDSYGMDTSVDGAGAFSGQTGAIDISKPGMRTYHLVKDTPAFYSTMFRKDNGTEQNVLWFIGLRIESLATDSSVTLDQMHNAIYTSLRLEGFECPTNL